jgi:hypothetical protein
MIKKDKNNDVLYGIEIFLKFFQKVVAIELSG